MTKIEVFEDRLIRCGMKEGDLSEYAVMLNRVHDNFLKLQHCTATAARFKTQNWEQAVRLIDFGVENYPDSWLGMYTAYRNKGLLFEHAKRYDEAYAAFRKAEEFVSDKPEYRGDIASQLLWTRMHIDGFMYSEELETYCGEIKGSANPLSKSFVNNQFRVAVAESIIALHSGDTTLAKQKKEEAKRIASPSCRSNMQDILDRHHFEDKLVITGECKRFLHGI